MKPISNITPNPDKKNNLMKTFVLEEHCILDQKWTERTCLQIYFVIWYFKCYGFIIAFLQLFCVHFRTHISFYDVNITDQSPKFNIYVEFD